MYNQKISSVMCNQRGESPVNLVIFIRGIVQWQNGGLQNRMCGFDSCYPCLMLLIFNQNHKRRNKIYRRRRGFLSKKTCLVVRRSKSFLRAKLRRFKIAFRHRLPKVKLKRRVIRQARRRFKIINTPKKRLYHFAQGARYLPKVSTSEVIFAQ